VGYADGGVDEEVAKTFCVGLEKVSGCWGNMLYVYGTCWNGVFEDIGCDASKYGGKGSGWKPGWPNDWYWDCWTYEEDPTCW